MRATSCLIQSVCEVVHLGFGQRIQKNLANALGWLIDDAPKSIIHNGSPLSGLIRPGS